MFFACQEEAEAEEEVEAPEAEESDPEEEEEVPWVLVLLGGGVGGLGGWWWCWWRWLCFLLLQPLLGKKAADIHEDAECSDAVEEPEDPDVEVSLDVCPCAVLR